MELLTLISGCAGMGVLVKISLGTPHLLFLNKFWTESGIYVSRSFFFHQKQSLLKAEERNAKQKKHERMSEASRLGKVVHRDCLT